jgi:hypothetical protein
MVIVAGWWDTSVHLPGLLERQGPLFPADPRLAPPAVDFSAVFDRIPEAAVKCVAHMGLMPRLDHPHRILQPPRHPLLEYHNVDTE